MTEWNYKQTQGAGWHGPDLAGDAPGGRSISR